MGRTLVEVKGTRSALIVVRMLERGRLMAGHIGHKPGRDPGHEVSVVLPTHRRIPYIEQTLRSVRAQSFDRWELIVVNDGWPDSDELAALLDGGPRERLIESVRPGSGIARARNCGLAAATGRFVAFLDHDDLWSEEHLASLVQALDGKPDAVGSYGRIRFIDGSGCELAPPAGGPTSYNEILAGGTRPTINSLLFRRAELQGMGGFDPLLEPSDDIDVIFKIGLQGPFVFAPEPVVSYRRHESNTSAERNTARVAEGARRVLDHHIAAARNRGDSQAAMLLGRNRRDQNVVWVSEARREAIRALQAGERGRAAQLVVWCFRYSPRGVFVDLIGGSRRKLVRPTVLLRRHGRRIGSGDTPPGPAGQPAEPRT
jgi:glycosyltransferase involved in cell wall biosynthesis